MTKIDDDIENKGTDIVTEWNYFGFMTILGNSKAGEICLHIVPKFFLFFIKSFFQSYLPTPFKKAPDVT